MDYGFGKTYRFGPAWTALNGSIQYYTVEAGVALRVEPEFDEKTKEIKNLDEIKEAQANLLRFVEILKTYGAQPVIAKVEGKKLQFCLEQPNVFGLSIQDGATGQVSEYTAEERIENAKAKIEKVFGEAKAVDGETKLFSKVVSVDYAI